MNIFKKLGTASFLMLALCAVIIIVAEYLFLTGDKLHGIFVGLWAPTLLGVMIYLKIIDNGGRCYRFLVLYCSFCSSRNLGFFYNKSLQ